MYNMEERMIACNYCGAINVFRHKHFKNRCVDCGKLYDRFKKAQRRGIQSELILCGNRLLERSKHASAELQQTFYKPIVVTMEEVNSRLKEEQAMTVTHKVCKQCGRDLPIENFRKYTPRGSGIYRTTQGRHTLCKDCEAISVRTSRALSTNNTEELEMLTQHYKLLHSRGLEPVTAPARKLLGVDEPLKVRQRRDLAALLGSVQATADSTAESDLDRHCRLVRERGYTCFEEADAAHRHFAAELQASRPEVYEEINNLMDDWYLEG